MAKPAKKVAKKPIKKVQKKLQSKLSIFNWSRNTQILVFAVVFGIVGGGIYLQLTKASDTSFSPVTFMRNNVPGTAHDAIPHGVPVNYEWQTKSVLKATAPPSSDSGYMNFWGQVYVDETNIRPSNTRVSVSACQLWGLKKSTNAWELLVNDVPTNLQGGAWPEDFSTNRVGDIDLRMEADGSMSMTNTDGRNAHFWSRKPLVYVGTDYSAIVVGCSAKLSLNSTTATDDRSQSHYMLSVGADWRKSNYECPVVNGATVCKSIGVGRFVKVSSNWQRVIFSTLSSSQIDAYPPLPISAYTNPDGTFGDQLPLTVENPADTTKPTVTITSPANGVKVNGRTTIAAKSTDNTKVTFIELYIDDKLITTAPASTVSYNWNVKAKNVTSGAHNITVKAYDTAGNIGQTTITVYK